MASINYLNKDIDSDFFQNCFERVPRKHEEFVGAQRNLQPISLDADGILSLRRAIGGQDTRRIRPVVRRIIESSGIIEGYDENTELICNMGVTILNQKHARQIFEKHYRSGFGLRALRRFNKQVRDFSKGINTENKNMFPQIGGFEVFGAKAGEDGMRFVAATIKDPESELIRNENDRLVQRLVPNYDVPMLQHLARRNEPHISIVKTSSQDIAEDLAAKFRDSEIADIWVQLRTAEQE